jgi:hypothetical protein
MVQATRHPVICCQTSNTSTRPTCFTHLSQSRVMFVSGALSAKHVANPRPTRSIAGFHAPRQRFRVMRWLLIGGATINARSPRCYAPQRGSRGSRTLCRKIEPRLHVVSVMALLPAGVPLCPRDGCHAKHDLPIFGKGRESDTPQPTFDALQLRRYQDSG